MSLFVKLMFDNSISGWNYWRDDLCCKECHYDMERINPFLTPEHVSYISKVKGILIPCPLLKPGCADHKNMNMKIIYWIS